MAGKAKSQPAAAQDEELKKDEELDETEDETTETPDAESSEEDSEDEIEEEAESEDEDEEESEDEEEDEEETEPEQPAAAQVPTPVVLHAPARPEGEAFSAGQFPIQGTKSEYVAVEHFHEFHRGDRQRVYSKKVHGKNFEDLAQSFAAANSKPNRLCRARYVSSNEAHAIEDGNEAEQNAINEKRDKQYRKGDIVTPWP